jgi:hypothetical protein
LDHEDCPAFGFVERLGVCCDELDTASGEQLSLACHDRAEASDEDAGELVSAEKSFIQVSRRPATGWCSTGARIWAPEVTASVKTTVIALHPAV